MSQPDIIGRLVAALGTLDPQSLETPPADRLGATLVLVEPRDDGETTIVYTRRRDDLRSHPGQISFPGGRVDAGETVEQAAVREAHEEVALDPSAIEILGRLPAFYIPPSRFWIQAVLAHWVAPHELVPAEAEVAAVLHVPMSRLLDPDARRVVRLSTAGWSWAWDLGDGHLLWGATAILTTFILGLLDPEWTKGAGPEEYADREVRPWEGAGRVVDRRGPARLPGVSEVTPDDAGVVDDTAASITPGRVAAAGAAVADAAQRLVPPGEAVGVMVGGGGTGAVGRAAAEVLAAAGVDVVLLDAAVWDGQEPPHHIGVVVDALVGSGLKGALRGAPLEMLNSMRLRARPIISVDVPSGLHAVDGMIGDTVSADVTVAIGAVHPGLLMAGLAPFVGDLYVAPLQGDHPLLRVVQPPTAATWRE